MVINCEFSAEALEDKLLNRLDKTQESVQELSRWLIKNHKNGDVVVKTWAWFSRTSNAKIVVECNSSMVH